MKGIRRHEMSHQHKPGLRVTGFIFIKTMHACVRACVGVSGTVVPRCKLRLLRTEAGWLSPHAVEDR